MKKNKSSNKDLQVEEWIKKGIDDELFADSILKHRDAPASGVCFHSHQMVEKLFKAYLVFQQNQYPKSHALGALWELCCNIDAQFSEIKDGAIFLNEYYIEARYPGDYPEYKWDEAEKAITIAKNIKKFILDKISGEDFTKF